MKKIITLALVASLAVCATSCDFLRTIAGRPTSKEIAQMAQQQEEAAVAEGCCADCQHLCEGCEHACSDCQAEPDTCACCQHACDSCKAECTGNCDSCKVACTECEGCKECKEPCEKCEGCTECTEAAPAEEVKAEEAAPAVEALPEAQPETYKYYVLLGSFADCTNATRMYKAAEKYNLNPSYIKISKKLTAVGVCPTNIKYEAQCSLKECKKLKFCPADAYVYEVK